MNKIEKYIYNKIRFSPKIKKWIVKTYQYIFSIVPISKIKSEYNIVTREGYFFGFHDKTPWSPDNQMLLAHKYSTDLKMPNENENIEIGYFYGNNFFEFKSIGKTKTWNWQMGSMLQWYKNDIIFNDYENSMHISKVVDINGNLINKYNRPIAALNPQYNIALSHSFIRLQEAAPAYCYANGTESTKDDLCPENDGIYLIDLKTTEIKKLFSLLDIAGYKSNGYAKDSYHYFTHCLFSPSGDRFAFYHRWIEPNNQTWTRLLTCNKDGRDLHLFKFSGVVTHLAWQDDLHLLAYGYKKEIGDNYYLLEDRSDNFKIIGQDSFTSDGHPQFSPNKNIFVTDTYPDRFRRQFLISYDMKTKKRNNIADNKITAKIYR